MVRVQAEGPPGPGRGASLAQRAGAEAADGSHWVPRHQGVDVGSLPASPSRTTTVPGNLYGPRSAARGSITANGGRAIGLAPQTFGELTRFHGRDGISLAFEERCGSLAESGGVRGGS